MPNRIARIEAGAWVWSAVETTTASILSPIWSSSSRKSKNFSASGYFSRASSSGRSLMSQTVTTRPCLAAWAVSPRSLPPTSIQAAWIESLGPNPPAHSRRPWHKIPKPAIDVPKRNARRSMRWFIGQVSRSPSRRAPVRRRGGRMLNILRGRPTGRQRLVLLGRISGWGRGFRGRGNPRLDWRGLKSRGGRPRRRRSHFRGRWELARIHVGMGEGTVRMVLMRLEPHAQARLQGVFDPPKPTQR